MKQKFYLCKHCGNIAAMVRDGGVDLVCCGEKMHELIPSSTDAAQEKHIPVLKQEGNKIFVSVGSVEHPMTAEHYIEWICLQTKLGSQHRHLTPGESPKACFLLPEGDEVEAIYAFCNLHSLWGA